MTYEIQIPGKLPGLNDYISACRTRPQAGAAMKRKAERDVSVFINRTFRGERVRCPVVIEYTWYEPNEKRDLDNIAAFGMKVIQDALVKCGVLKNDGWKYIIGFENRFRVDRKDPHITVIIKEVAEFIK